MKAVRPRVSYADLERAPEDGRRYELYDGEVFVVPAPLLRHQIVQLRIAEMLDRYAVAHGGVEGEFGRVHRARAAVVKLRRCPSHGDSPMLAAGQAAGG